MFLFQLESSITVLKDEIRRLHKEVLQVRTELKLERARSCDLAFSLQDKEQELVEQRKIYDEDMKNIASKLLLLEADFRKEHNEIQTLLFAKDVAIESMNKELADKDRVIESLKHKVESLRLHPLVEDTKQKLEKKIDSQKTEIDALRSANARLLESLSHVRLQPNSNRQGKLRRSSTPTRTARAHGSVNGKNRLSSMGSHDPSEWKEELSAFF